MEVFRISTVKYAKQLTAAGVPRRWNLEGEFVLYTGCNRALSALELVVHRKSLQQGLPYRMMVISIADDDQLYSDLKIRDLPPGWRTFFAYGSLQKLGSNWYQNQRSLVLKVPSAVIPQEFNYVINTRHPDFKSKVKLVRTEDYFWDERLMDAD